MLRTTNTRSKSYNNQSGVRHHRALHGIIGFGQVFFSFPKNVTLIAYFKFITLILDFGQRRTLAFVAVLHTLGVYERFTDNPPTGPRWDTDNINIHLMYTYIGDDMSSKTICNVSGIFWKRIQIWYKVQLF